MALFKIVCISSSAPSVGIMAVERLQRHTHIHLHDYCRRRPQAGVPSYPRFVQVCHMWAPSFYSISFFYNLIFRHFPESCALIIIGLLIGVIVYYGVDHHSHHFPSFTASLFFNVLLPPIILGERVTDDDRLSKKLSITTKSFININIT